MPTKSSNQQIIGTVSSLSGNVYLETLAGKSLLTPNSEVYSDSVIVTESGSSASVRFADETVLALGENSRVTLDDYVFGTSAESNLLFEMGQGSFRMITGKIADQNPEQFNIKTPLASIGIRGTDFSIIVLGGNEQFLLNEIDPNHILMIQDEFGTVRFINTAGMIVTIQEGEPLSPARLATEAEIATILSLTPSITSLYEKEDSEGESGVDQSEGEVGSDSEIETESETESDHNSDTDPGTEANFDHDHKWSVNSPFGDLEYPISTLAFADTDTGMSDGEQIIDDLTLASNELLLTATTDAGGGGGGDVGLLITGGANGDPHNGGAGNDTIWGMGGNDTILGLAGNDSIIGGDGIDSLSGGNGSDIFSYAKDSELGDIITDFNADSVGDKIHFDVNEPSGLFSNAKTTTSIGIVVATNGWGVNTKIGVFNSSNTASTAVNLFSFANLTAFKGAFTSASLNDGVMAFGLVGTKLYGLIGDTFTTTFFSTATTPPTTITNTFYNIATTYTIATLANVTGVGVGINQISGADIIIY